MSYNLSVKELNEIIKSKKSKPKDEKDPVKNFLLYILNLINIIFYGDTFIKDTKEKLNDQKIKLQKIYDDLMSSDSGTTYNNIYKNVPNPRDMVYFVSGNNKDIMGAYNNVNNAFTNMIIATKSDSIVENSKENIKYEVLYDDDKFQNII